MQENTNRAIAYNSVILYAKMIINTVCALLTTRFALQALGVVDYGLYTVLGGVISFMGIFNTIMVSSSHRFIAVAIGEGNDNEVNKQFCVSFIIHVAIAVGVLLIAYPIGNWYIPRFVNYEGDITNAMMVYLVSMAGSVLSFVGVPYNALLMAKERFLVFSLVDVVSHVLKLAVALILVYCYENKLLIYTLVMAILTALPTLIFMLYCKRYYREWVLLRLVKDKMAYKRVFGFSSWVAIGAVASVGKAQGAALVVNAFFNTVMNSAMGVASSINSYIGMFAQGITQPMQPQIVKSYTVGEYNRTDELLIMSAKYSFMLTFLVGSVFLVAPDWLLGLWLGDVPPFASVFLVLFIIDNIVRSVNAGVSNIIFACGKISLFQALTSLLNIASIVLGYFVLKTGAPAYYLIVAYIFVSVCMFFAIQYSLHKTLHYNNKKLWKESYIPSLITVVLFVPIVFLPNSIHPAVRVLVSFVYLCLLEWFVCFSKVERARLLHFFKERIKYT